MAMTSRVWSQLLKLSPNLRDIRNYSRPISTGLQFRLMSSTPQLRAKKQKVEVVYVRADGEKFTATGKEGDNLLDIAVDNNIDLEGFGACEGTLACSTCHLVFSKEHFDKIEEAATDEELDMLDLAYGLTETSRLGCQVCMTKELSGLEVKVPEGVTDVRES